MLRICVISDRSNGEAGLKNEGVLSKKRKKIKEKNKLGGKIDGARIVYVALRLFEIFLGNRVP